MACTTVLVGRKASNDGSTMISTLPSSTFTMPSDTEATSTSPSGLVIFIIPGQTAAIMSLWPAWMPDRPIRVGNTRERQSPS